MDLIEPVMDDCRLMSGVPSEPEGKGKAGDTGEVCREACWDLELCPKNPASVTEGSREFPPVSDLEDIERREEGGLDHLARSMHGVTS